MNTWEKLSLKAKWIVITATIARVVMFGIAYTFVGGFVMAIISGLTELTAWQIAILDYIVTTVVGLAAVITSAVHIFKVYFMYTGQDDDEE